MSILFIDDKAQTMLSFGNYSTYIWLIIKLNYYNINYFLYDILKIFFFILTK